MASLTPYTFLDSKFSRLSATKSNGSLLVLLLHRQERLSCLTLSMPTMITSGLSGSKMLGVLLILPGGKAGPFLEFSQKISKYACWESESSSEGEDIHTCTHTHTWPFKTDWPGNKVDSRHLLYIFRTQRGGNAAWFKAWRFQNQTWPGSDFSSVVHSVYALQGMNLSLKSQFGHL